MSITGTNPAPTTDTGNKFKAAFRYIGSNASGAMMVLVALGAVDPETSSHIIALFQKLSVQLHELFGTLGQLWILIFPIVSGILLKMGINSSGFGVMMDKVFAAAKSGNVAAQVSIVTAAASPEIGTKAVINPELAANPATPSNVVAAPNLVPPTV